jgi:hypothetical protein
MKRDYPEEEELQKVREWEGLNDPKGLIDFIGSIWHWVNLLIVVFGSKLSPDYYPYSYSTSFTN